MKDKKAKMPKRSIITDSAFPNSSPHITRSEIKSSTLSNLDSTDSIIRSSLSSVSVTNNLVHQGPSTTSSIPDASITRTRKHKEPQPLSLTRCTITSSTLSHVQARRCKITDSALSNVTAARSTVASSTLDNVSLFRRAQVSNSTIAAYSALSRVTAADSTISNSAVFKSHLEKTRVLKSRVKKARLRDCEVSDCVIINTDFRGMVLRNGVWKDGKLVGRIGEWEGERGVEGMDVERKEDVVAVNRDGEALDMPMTNEKNAGNCMEGFASETDSSDGDGSDTEEEKDRDLPPPYSP